MALSICFTGNNLDYPQGGGHLWVHLNWALSFRALGCDVFWLEPVDPSVPVEMTTSNLRGLRTRLSRFGLADSIVLCSLGAEPLSAELTGQCLDLDAVAEADLLFDLRYDLSAELVGRFRRTAFLDIDPGELHVWMSKGVLRIAPHYRYFTIGETVGHPSARFPDAGIEWLYTPPCVYLPAWPVAAAAPAAPFTTVSHWHDDGWMEEGDYAYIDSKRWGFLPYFDLPQRTSQKLELAVDIDADDADYAELTGKGWLLRDSRSVASTPWDYQRYIQTSKGEFSCAKPHCTRLQNAWVSDRTLCYLASSKPVVVEHTGPSRFLPDCEGMFRFRTMAEAAGYLEMAAGDYEHQCRAARALADEYFDGIDAAKRILEHALA